MKKTLKVLVIILVLAFSVAITASAASFTSLADDLKEIGMFTGTDVGYELDREPTRAEAAVMLVRMLGEEENAAAAYAAGTISCPFTDVPDWAQSQIAYLYSNSLTNGVSDTEFGSSNICSAQMYCTYILRVLGYSDKEDGDFTYDGALDFAAQIGLADSTLVSGTFTRDSLVAISYQALATNVKDGDGNLLSKLIADGAIDADAAAKITERIAIYDDINAVSEVTNSSLDADMTMDISMTMNGETVTISDVTSSIKANITADSIEAEIISAMTDPTNNETINMSEWIKDGWVYIDDGTNKTKMSMNYDQLLETIQNSSMSYGTLPIYCYSELAEVTADGETTYSVSIAPEYLNAIVGSILGQSLGDTQGMNIVFNSVMESFSLDENGMLANINMQMDMSMSYPGLGDISATVSADMTINSIGSAVTIDFPDFTDFTESEVTPEVAE
jgi:hypothetical protein